jgi:hypothetical protein
MALMSAQLRSSALASADYDPITQTLTLNWLRGQSTTYDNVPQEIFEGLKDAASPGAYYHAIIKDQF